MSKKFFNKSDLFYNLSTESIKIQPNDYSVQAITAEFQKIIDVLENDNTANSLVAIKNKDIAQAFVNIDNILTKRFGMKYRHIVTTNVAYACFTAPPENYSSVSKFNSDYFKFVKSLVKNTKEEKVKTVEQIKSIEKDGFDLTYRWVESMKAMEKTLNTKGVKVDLEKATVSNLPSDYTIFAMVDISLLVSTLKLTARQITAILYHEVGHSFTHIEYSYKVINNTTSLIDSIKEGIEKKNKSLKDSLLIAYERTYNESTVDLKDKNTVLVLLKTVEKHIEYHAGFNPSRLGTIDSEQLADQFATRFGLGDDLIIALSALNEHFKNEYQSGFAYSMMLLQSLLLLSALGIIITASFVGGLIFTVVIILTVLVVNIVSSYLTGGSVETDKVYDTYKRRMIRVKNDIVRQLRTNDIPKDVITALLTSIDNITNIIKDVPDDKPGLIDRFMINFTSAGKRASEYKNIEEITENLMENDLHVVSAKFKNLI